MRGTLQTFLRPLANLSNDTVRHAILVEELSMVQNKTAYTMSKLKTLAWEKFFGTRHFQI